MASFFSSLRDVLRHPASTAIGLLTGVGSIAGMLVTVQTGLAQVAAVHGIHPVLATQTQHISGVLGTMASIALIVVSCGESLLGVRAPVVPPMPDGTNILPFYSSAASAQTQSSNIERKAA